MQKLTDIFHALLGKNFFILGLILIAVGMPVSPFLVSSGQILMSLNWLLEGKFSAKFEIVKNDKALQAFLLIFLVHILWLINTSDFTYAFHDLKVKLPLLLIPFLIATGAQIDKNGLRFILLIFVATVTVGTFIGTAVYFNLFNYSVNDVRNISVFISHIRFSLMIVYSMVILGYYLYLQLNSDNPKRAILYLVPVFWLLFYLFIQQTLTSWVIGFILFYSLFLVYFKKIKKVWLRCFSWFVVIGLPVMIVGFIALVVVHFYHVDKVDLNHLPKYTAMGNKYKHITDLKNTENGHYVWLYICDDELMQKWPDYSKLPLDGNDEKGQPLKFTMIRYLTSKNLTKDAEGLSKLDSIDLRLIEAGFTSCIYRSSFTPYIKINEIIWELNEYVKYGDPNAKTVSMRIEFLKAGWHIVKHHVFFGVGTGDIKNAFNDYYNETNSVLLPQYRLRTHNQYLTFIITFGLIGFAIIVFGFTYALNKNRHKKHVLLFSFLMIALLSMINEDTLETQMGVTFVTYFYSLFVFRKVDHE